MSHVYNASGAIKATVTATKPAGYAVKGKKAFSPGRLLLTTAAPSSGSVVFGAGTNNGMLSVVAGPAPAAAIRRGGKAFLNGQQYYVTSGTKAYCIDRLSYTSNGDLLVDTT